MTRWLVVALVMGLIGAARADTPTKLTKAYDVTFAEVDGQKLKLDVVQPEGPGPHPCVICWHGGAWKLGSRKDLSTTDTIYDFGAGGKSLLEALASNGFVAVSASYRLAPAHRWPAQIQDAKTAVRFLRQNANKYNIDPDRIGAMGFSAGGHLAALVGTVKDQPEFEGPLFPKQSSQVKCVVDFFGPADLTLFTETPSIDKAFMRPLFGEASPERTTLMKQASPVEHVSKDTVPFLIIHGTLDVVVPIKHSELLHKKLTAAGIATEFVKMPFRGHGWFGEASVECLAKATKYLKTQLDPVK